MQFGNILYAMALKNLLAAKVEIEVAGQSVSLLSEGY